ncbi:MAG TPA: helix-turn-helix domain-containing protein [Desulfomonilaceae bacterium]|nr:helix-turn-helix domain-containing protein [Desulfomonilaceae bacterium]
MKSDKLIPGPDSDAKEEERRERKAKTVLSSNIGDSLDMLVEYLVDNHITGIHPLIMGEIEKRLIIKVLERSRGNKLQAAKWLGMSRNTFQRKIQKVVDLRDLTDKDTES